METLGLLSNLSMAVRLLVVIVVALAASGVAVVLTRRGQAVLAAWGFALGWWATILLSVLQWVNGAFLTAYVGYGVTRWVGVALNLLDVLVFLLLGVALFLMKPSKGVARG